MRFIHMISFLRFLTLLDFFGKKSLLSVLERAMKLCGHENSNYVKNSFNKNIFKLSPVIKP